MTYMTKKPIEDLEEDYLDDDANEDIFQEKMDELKSDLMNE